MRIAVVGSGISGLTAAWLLSRHHEVVLYEAEARLGGHTHTVAVNLGDREFAVDTGFIVYNEENYPNFSRLLQCLGVATQPSSMSFSVRDDDSGLEYNGTSLNALFAQRRNLLRPVFWRMVLDILRFFREARELVGSSERELTLGEWVRRRGFSEPFLKWHLYPLVAAVWSTGRLGVENFPAVMLTEFFHNHGFLRVAGRPRWRVLRGGSHSYLPPLTRPFRDRIRLATPVVKVVRERDGVRIRDARGGEDHFDHVVLAVHSDQALSLLGDPSPEEREILGAIRYQVNEVVLHTDSQLLPRRPLARASWNFHLPLREDWRPTVTYWMNSLQSLPGPPDFCVTLNRTEAVRPDRILRRLEYAHPVFDPPALAAQRRKHEICGQRRTWYCGAYWGYGFHEDGVRSALDACRELGGEW
ncbi:MAG: FAD-dependent oxidoreductase [Acidobacteriota bacterium]